MVASFLKHYLHNDDNEDDCVFLNFVKRFHQIDAASRFISNSRPKLRAKTTDDFSCVYKFMA